MTNNMIASAFGKVFAPALLVQRILVAIFTGLIIWVMNWVVQTFATSPSWGPVITWVGLLILLPFIYVYRPGREEFGDLLVSIVAVSGVFALMAALNIRWITLVVENSLLGIIFLISAIWVSEGFYQKNVGKYVKF